jgi:hypothetical protein
MGLGIGLFLSIFQDRHSVSMKHSVFRIMYCNQTVDNFSRIAVVIILHQTGCDHLHPHSICLTLISFRNEKQSMLHTFGNTVGSFKKCHLDRTACFFLNWLILLMLRGNALISSLSLPYNPLVSHDQEMIVCSPCC